MSAGSDVLKYFISFAVSLPSSTAALTYRLREIRCRSSNCKIWFVWRGQRCLFFEFRCYTFCLCCLPREYQELRRGKRFVKGAFFLSVTKYAHTHRITIAIWQLFPIGSHVQNVGQCLVGRALMRKGGRLDKICALQIRRRRANRRAK